MAKNKTKKEKKPMSKARKIISWITTGIFAVIFLILATFQISGMVNQTNYQNTVKIKNYFGYHVMEVLTDSMDPIYPKGSTIIIKTIDDPSKIKEGDDVTFLYDIIAAPGFDGKEVVTHRVSKVITPSEAGDNLYHFEAHGINANSEQCSGDCTGQTQAFTQNDLIGVVQGQSKVLGFFFNLVTQWWGMLIILLIPTGYLIVTSIIDIVKAVKDDDEDDDNDKPDAGDKTSLSELSSEDKERLKQQLIAKILEEKKVKSND